MTLKLKYFQNNFALNHILEELCCDVQCEIILAALVYELDKNIIIIIIFSIAW